MRISDWSSNVCSSDLTAIATAAFTARTTIAARFTRFAGRTRIFQFLTGFLVDNAHRQADLAPIVNFEDRSEEHTSDLQSLMRISYAVFCLKKKNNKH